MKFIASAIKLKNVFRDYESLLPPYIVLRLAKDALTIEEADPKSVVALRCMLHAHFFMVYEVPVETHLHIALSSWQKMLNCAIETTTIQLDYSGKGKDIHVSVGQYDFSLARNMLMVDDIIPPVITKTEPPYECVVEVSVKELCNVVTHLAAFDELVFFRMTENGIQLSVQLDGQPMAKYFLEARKQPVKNETKESTNGFLASYLQAISSSAASDLIEVSMSSGEVTKFICGYTVYFMKPHVEKIASQPKWTTTIVRV